MKEPRRKVQELLPGATQHHPRYLFYWIAFSYFLVLLRGGNSQPSCLISLIYVLKYKINLGNLKDFSILEYLSLGLKPPPDKFFHIWNYTKRKGEREEDSRHMFWEAGTRNPSESMSLQTIQQLQTPHRVPFSLLFLVIEAASMVTLNVHHDKPIVLSSLLSISEHALTTSTLTYDSGRFHLALWVTFLWRGISSPGGLVTFQVDILITLKHVWALAPTSRFYHHAWHLMHLLAQQK